MRFIKKIQNFSYANGILQKDQKIIIGVSGGPDSTCLLHVLHFLAKKYSYQLHVAHVNYQLRGIDSEKDEQFVKKLGEKMGIPVTVHRVKNALTKRNSEERLRNERYAFFESLRAELGFDLIAVAHTKDDQAETVLMRIIRGAGIEGLAAMRAKNGRIIRPLLGIYRAEVLAYLKENKLLYRIDKTNKQSLYFRNKIRNKLIPYLEKNFSPAIKESLARLATAAACDYDRLGSIGCKELIKFSSGRAQLNVLDLEKCSSSEVTGLLREMIRITKGDLKGVGQKHLDEILKIIKSKKNKTQKMSFCGLKLERKGDKVTLYLYK